MTRSQRRRHLAMWCIIGPAAILTIIAAVVARPSHAVTASTSAVRTGAAR